VTPSKKPAGPIPGRCGSPKRKKPGQFCGAWPLDGRTRCRLHGGASPVGPASATWKHGRHSIALRGDLLERYQRASQDPELASLRSELQLVDARMGEVLGRVGPAAPASPGAMPVDPWQSVRHRFEAFTVAARSGNQAAGQAALRSLETAILDGVSAAAAWREVYDLTELRAKLVVAEARRARDQQEMISSTEAIALMTALVIAVDRVLRKAAEAAGGLVPHATLTAEVSNEYTRITGRRGDVPLGAGSGGAARAVDG
jgi:hypothetical protein